MISKSVLVSIAIWAVAVTPALCMGGWLGHPCSHTSHSGHAHEEAGEAALPFEEHHGDECTHESGCSADPCSQLVRPDDDLVLQTVFVADQQVLGTSHDSRQLTSLFSSNSHAPGAPPNSHHLKGRPFPDRDIPLLI